MNIINDRLLFYRLKMRNHPLKTGRINLSVQSTSTRSSRGGWSLSRYILYDPGARLSGRQTTTYDHTEISQ